MYRYFFIFYIAIVVISCRNSQEKILPQKRTLTQSVYTSVTVQPDSLYRVYSSVAGILDENRVEEGALVLKDQAIIEVINNTPKLNTQNAKLALDLAKENYNGNTAVLSKVQDEINAGKLTLKNDSINYCRQKNLWEQKIGSKVEYDTKKLKYELSKNTLKVLQDEYNRTKNELKTIVEQATNNYKVALNTTGDFTIKSTMNGKVYALYKEPGELVNSSQPLASIGSASNFILELLVDEIDIVKISEGQEMVITLDAYEDEVFTGVISKIYPEKDKRNQTFIVEGIFSNPPQKLYPGLSGEANIIVSIKEDVLTIPTDYLIDGDSVKTKDGEISIKTGIQNLEFVEILSGITKDVYIFKPE